MAGVGGERGARHVADERIDQGRVNQHEGHQPDEYAADKVAEHGERCSEPKALASGV